MPAMAAKPRTLVAFFSLTFVFTWTCFFAAAAMSRHGVAPRALGIVVLLGVFGPGIVALSMSAVQGGKREVINLLQRLVRWRAAVRWYFFAGFFMIAIKLFAALIARAATGAWPRFGTEGPLIMLAATIISVAVGGQAGEEIGWRGYALPRLASHVGFAWGSVVLGVLWALWHLPLFFILGGDTVGQSFPVYLLQVTALSVALAWLYTNTNGSLLLTMLMHAAINNTKDIVPSGRSGASDPFTLNATAISWSTVVLLWICAIYFLFRMRRAEASVEVNVDHSVEDPSHDLS